MSTSTFLNSSSNRSSLLNEPDLISESTDALNLNNAEVDIDSIFHSSYMKSFGECRHVSITLSTEPQWYR